MKSLVPKEVKSLTVGQVVDAMHQTGGFAPLGREDIMAVVEMFLRDYVGLPGTVVTKRFTIEGAKDMSAKLGIDVDNVVKVITVFKLRAGKSEGAKTKLMKAYNKVRAVRGGTRFGVTSRM